MSRHRDEHLDLCAAHVLGVLDEADRAELESHLATGCEVCLAELRALSGGATVLALSAPALRAPAVARERVLAAVADEHVEPAAPRAEHARSPILPMPERARSSVATWAWAAAAVVLAVAGVAVWQRGVALDRRLAEARAREAALERTLEAERAWADLLAAPGARVVRLAATPGSDSTLRAQVVYDPASRRAVVTAERLRPPADRAYELWAITASGPMSLGVVSADPSGRVVARLEQVGGPEAIAAFAFSLEARGGSPDRHKPNGPVVLVGYVGG